MIRVVSIAICVGLVGVLHAPAATGAETRAVLPQAILRESVAKGESLWRQVADTEPRSGTGCRPILAYALTLCEAREHPERIERLLALVRRMQDVAPKSRNFGNLKWYWRDPGVTDANAVDFCMHDALVIHIRHGDWLPEAARKELSELMRLGVEGSLRHRVPADYTNISILNCGNLIVLGEHLNRPDASQEGYRRFDAFCQWTAAHGIHEFCSPTYYDIDLNGLLMLHSYAKNARQREQAEALLKLFWTDIGANWFSPAQRLGGCHSRSYDYLYGRGSLDWHVWVQGWLDTAKPDRAERREPWSREWTPPPALHAMSINSFPRRVREHWGLLATETRCHMLYRDISLSCSGACYGSQDMPLTVDLPGTRDVPRCYFIADGRDDPYGKKKYETGSAKHLKALHLQPLWAGTQRGGDALGLVVYRGTDLAIPQVTRVQSHFVLRRSSDGIWLGGKRLSLPAGSAENPSEVPIPNGQCLVLRYGSAAVGVRWPWIDGKKSQQSYAALVDDGNTFGCLRLTVDHGTRAELETNVAAHAVAGAALWVRVGSNLASDADFQRWRNAFEAARPSSVQSSDKRMRIVVPGTEGPLSIDAEPPWDRAGRVSLVPEPFLGVLEIDGKDVGRPLLDAVNSTGSTKD